MIRLRTRHSSALRHTSRRPTRLHTTRLHSSLDPHLSRLPTDHAALHASLHAASTHQVSHDHITLGLGAAPDSVARPPAARPHRRAAAAAASSSASPSPRHGVLGEPSSLLSPPPPGGNRDLPLGLPVHRDVDGSEHTAMALDVLVVAIRVDRIAWCEHTVHVRAHGRGARGTGQGCDSPIL